MQTLIWNQLNLTQQQDALQRPAVSSAQKISQIVKEIITQVRTEDDDALRELTKKFDKVAVEQLRVSQQQIRSAGNNLSGEFKQAIKLASSNIAKFHQAQKPTPTMIETQPGIRCELRYSAVEKVGLYVPGGSAPLPSTVMMLAIPAKIAGCSKIILCSPAPISDAILYTADMCGVDEIYSIGGAQAIAAMAYGTQSVPKVDKIFGPGNAFVTEAKRQVAEDYQGAAMDLPAGPSEVLVVADAQANPAFVAADLLSQAEHGPDSQVLLVSDSNELTNQVNDEINRQTTLLERREIAEQALANSRAIIVESLEQAMEVSNRYGPEHLIIQTEQPRQLLPWVKNAGSVFLGAWTPESVGDYASGTNHTLPTYGYTRTYSSLGTADFMKRYTVQELSEQSLRNLAPTVIEIANAEGLSAHRRAVTLRIGQEK
ncbi:histidinol dehydrogenase [Celerinatantimonas diazotrophica]|uniref:Histidinol dehydrogenase n=1 Tax=Celerinatantimonas diazotrophica TaxID=412034 RepID=A0A4R1JAP0_9GAMM|nr:histidinol dehydrogenase [Celerinatantimonas diazotrophica]TCK47610.1 histidinol dehydrogenase [Celerinatantimonas diazotrophica]CAG9296767.1 Histidinol dehydrogenase [Celerinatantimonas diazotrophica]